MNIIFEQRLEELIVQHGNIIGNTLSIVKCQNGLIESTDIKHWFDRYLNK